VKVRIAIFFLLLCSGSLAAFQSIVILPFSNESDQQHIYWLGEGFAESLSEEIQLQDAFIVQRAERKAAYEEMRLPYTGDLSRATMLKISQKLGADYVVFGWYNLKNDELTVEAKVIHLATAKLSQPIRVKGTLNNLYQLQTDLKKSLIQYFAAQKLVPVQEKPFEAGAVPLYAYEYYIKSLLQTSDTERIKFLQRAIQLNPNYSQAIYRLGVTLSRLQRYREANEYLQNSQFKGIFQAKADFLMGLNAFFSNNYEGAYQKWLELSKSYPTAEVMNNIGVALLKKGDLSGSGWYLSKAVELNPKNPDYHFNLAASYVQRQYDTHAILQYREAVQLRPSDYQAFYLMSRLLQRENKDSSQTKIIQQLFYETLPADQKGKFPDQYTSVIQLLRPDMELLSKEEKQYSSASQQKGSQQREGYAKTYQNSARKYLEDQEADKALVELRKAITVEPFNQYLHYLFGWALVQKKDYSAAVPELEFAVWCKDNVESHLLLAEMYREAQKYADSKLQVQKSLALDPSNKKALEIWNDIWNKQ
jgi:tetratricopeptide (TPR) repeat protein